MDIQQRDPQNTLDYIKYFPIEVWIKHSFIKKIKHIPKYYTMFYALSQTWVIIKRMLRWN